MRLKRLLPAAAMAAAVTFSAGLAATPVQAAPQILAALQTWDGVPFHCTGGLCKANLATYCLQKDRPAPDAGQAYYPAVPEAFTLVITDQNGHQRSLPAATHVAFVEARGFMSVAGVIGEGDLAALTAGGTATLVVAENASLLPVAEPGDPNPITAEEVAFATQSLRSHGQRIVDTSVKGQTAQVLAHVKAKLPPGATLPQAASETFWRQTIGDELPTRLPASTLGIAKGLYESCFNEVGNYRFSDMRRCLEWRQDDLIRELNTDYWRNQPGS